MGLFGFFKKKEVSEETRQGFLNKLLTKYFEGSKAKLGADVISKFSCNIFKKNNI